MSKQDALAYSIELINSKSGKKLLAQVHLPTEKTVAPPQSIAEKVDGDLKVWIANFSLVVDGKETTHQAGGDDWLQAILVAITGIRRAISQDDPRDWLTPDGVPSWVVLPVLVPISWGYEHFANLCRMIDAEEAKMHQAIEARRR